MGHKGDIHGAWTYTERGHTRKDEVHEEGTHADRRYTRMHNTEEIKAGNSSVDY